ncbi:succinate dehydrogenase cytochrome b subunit [Sandaracinus amylolyticus]|uniref:succinate dehydrogenase cytochrome b subunit n=1 Tax=Sandaracinus amylolyticus TaxID=927083 RepID=UPI001F33943D|nr:succinate dehydrogenase cytochrome b subunit [Sandaracinus amylolyticus]UJR81842.1 Succinate dehydrogenase cytochrome b subunit [Sandaracinus amylolyticus]
MQAVSLRARSLSTSLFLKTLLALSGAGWFFFLLNHLYSNLHLFLGRDAFNGYYDALKESPAMLWGIRGVLIAGIVVHVGTSIVITRRSLESRPQRYHVKKDVVTTYAARTMRWTGPIVGLYLVYHILHLTVGAAMPAGLAHDPHDYYGNVVRSFQVPWVAAFYVVANGALTVHLAHGVSSLFQTLGLVDPQVDKTRNVVAIALAALVCVGFASMPIAVWAGVLVP